MFRKTVPLALVLLLLLGVFAGCAGKNNGEEASTELDANVAAIVDALKPQTAGHLVTRTDMDDDGAVAVKYFDENKNLVEEYKLDGDAVSAHKVMTYNAQKQLTKEEELSPDGALQSATMYRYDDAGSVSERRVSVYEDGRLRQTTCYDADGKETQYVRPEYTDDGFLKKLTNLNTDETVINYFTYEYDDAHNLVKSSRFDGADKLESYTVYTYKDKNLVKQENFGADGKLTEYFEYDYDANGVRTVSRQYDANGNLINTDNLAEPVTTG